MKVVFKTFDDMLQPNQKVSYSLLTTERLRDSDVLPLSQPYLDSPKRTKRNNSNKTISSENL